MRPDVLQRRYRRARRILLSTTNLVIAATGLIILPVLRAQKPKPSEYAVKAAYLYTFGRFVEWPAEATALKGNSFEICAAWT